MDNNTENPMNCAGYVSLDRRLIVLETEQNNMKGDIAEIKESLKEGRMLTLTTLISSVLGLIGIIASFLMR